MEYLHWRYPRGSMMDKPPGYQLTATFSVPGFVFISYKLIGTFLFGAAVTHSSTDTIKFSVGRLRPHFLAVCRPNITAGLCDSHVPGIYVYVDNFTCTGPKDHALHDSRYALSTCPVAPSDGLAWQSRLLSSVCQHRFDFSMLWVFSVKLDISSCILLAQTCSHVGLFLEHSTDFGQIHPDTTNISISYRWQWEPT